MIDIKIDTSLGGTWDLVIGDDLDLETVEDEFEVAQRCAVATRTHKGEWAYDTDEGLDWLGEILVKAPNIPRITDRIRALWFSIEGVTEILKLVLTPDYGDRDLLIDGAINTIYGPADIRFTV